MLLIPLTLLIRWRLATRVETILEIIVVDDEVFVYITCSTVLWFVYFVIYGCLVSYAFYALLVCFDF
jgi:hypothetical protein